jgi:uncharacterized cupredoxin-like copper-binding protein
VSRLLIPIAIVAAIVLSFGGGADAGGAFKVTLDEWRISPETATLKAGKVTFVAENTGKVEHELLVLKTDLAADELPVGLEGPALTLPGMKLVLGKPHQHKSGFDFDGALRNRHINPGSDRRDVVTLTKGRYVLLCNLPGHYQAGQRATLVVE